VNARATVALAAAAVLLTTRASAQSSPPAGEPTPPEEAPAAAEPASADAAPAADSIGPPTPPPPREEQVEVRGRRGTKAGQTSFRADEVRQIPGAFGDAFRVVEVLPGVTPMLSGLPFYFVRGAPPGNNGYYLDGVRIPLLYHAGAGPSVVHPGLVDRVDFYPGGYPARFGRFAGGILSGDTRRPADELHGEGNIRLFDAGALVETPFLDNRGTALVAGRYSYTAALISLAAPEAVLDYWDYQARVTYKLGEKDTIGVFAFGSYDYFGEKRRGEEQPRTAFATQFHRIDARWDHELPNRGRMRTAFTVGSDQTGTEDLSGVRDRMLAARVYVEQPVGRDVIVRGGTDVTFDHYDLLPGNRRQARSEQASLYPPRNDLVAGVHLDAVIQVTPRWELTPGMRLDQFSSARDLTGTTRAEQRRSGNAAIVAFDPRLLSRLKLSKAVTFISTFGLSHQPPAFFVPIPGLQLGRLAGGLQTSIQASQGIEVALPLGFTLTPTAFYHRYLGLTDFATTCGDTGNGDFDEVECIDQRVRGRTVGFELLLRRSLTARLTGWVAYTLSRTTRETSIATPLDLAPDAFDAIGRRPTRVVRQEIPGDFDRTHVLNVVGAYDLGAGWRAGARFFFYTGRPYTRRVYGFPVPPFNQERFPAFYRIDGRIEKAWRIGEKGRISFIIEWLNLTLRKEATSVDCTPNGDFDLERVTNGPCTFEEIGPITIPSLGVEGSF